MFQSAEKEGLSHDAGKLLLRLTLGGLILFHGIAKIEHGVDSIANGLVNLGLPGAIAYLVYVGEVVAPILLILGIVTRAAALVVAINMIVAVASVHTGQLLSISESGGYALELQAFYLLTAAAIALLGAGRYSLGGQSRWN
jgi:putative oxidoreductase